MAADLEAAAQALEEGRTYARRERERRIGLTYVTTGVSVGLTFVVYALLMMSPWDVPGVVWALAWLPVVAAVSVARRRYFRRLPTSPQQIWGTGDWWWVFVGLWVAAPFAAKYAGHPEWSWPLIGAIFGVMFLTQAAMAKDRAHATLGAGTIVASALLVLVPHENGLQPLLLGLVLGGTLVALGVMRVRRA